MIFDSTNKFSTEQEFTDSAVSTNVIDLGVLGRDIGVGEAIPLFVGVDTTFAGLTSLQVSVETDDDSAFSAATVVASTGAVPVANLIAGYQFALQSIPKGVVGRYVRLSYTVVGTGTAGAVSAGITMGNQTNG